MNLLARALALTGILLGGVTAGGGAFAQKPGGTLKVYFFDSPGSMSIHEESTIAGQGPAQGVFKIGGAMRPPPEGQWGMPPERLQTIPGYGPDIGKNRAEARTIMEKLGYGPGKALEIKVSTRNVPTYRDPAVILIDQLKEIHINGVLDTVETANWHSKVTRKDYMVGLNNTGSGVDDPDQQFYENYACGSDRNYSGYCNAELNKKFDEQSALSDQDKRRKLVWEIDKKLQEGGARPIIFHTINATCWQPQVKGLTMMVNSIYNGWRFEDVWFDK